MCNDNYIEMPEWFQEKIRRMYEEGMFLDVRCLEALNIHENCDHTRPPITFGNLNVR